MKAARSRISVSSPRDPAMQETLNRDQRAADIRDERDYRAVPP